MIPFAFPDPAETAAGRRADALVATFGLLAPVKQTTKVVEAFALVAQARGDARLAVSDRRSRARRPVGCST